MIKFISYYIFLLIMDDKKPETEISYSFLVSNLKTQYSNRTGKGDFDTGRTIEQLYGSLEAFCTELYNASKVPSGTCDLVLTPEGLLIDSYFKGRGRLLSNLAQKQIPISPSSTVEDVIKDVVGVYDNQFKPLHSGFQEYEKSFINDPVLQLLDVLLVFHPCPTKERQGYSAAKDFEEMVAGTDSGNLLKYHKLDILIVLLTEEYNKLGELTKQRTEEKIKEMEQRRT